MFTLIKFLKIVLPVATVTTATIATVSLVSFSKIDLDKTKDNEDQELNDFVGPNERHEEEKLFYSKDGDAEKLTSVSSEQAKQIEKALQEKNGELGKGKQLGGDVSKEVAPPRADEKTDGDSNRVSNISSKTILDQNLSESGSENSLDNGVDKSKDIGDLPNDSVTEAKLPTSESKPQESQSMSLDNGPKKDLNSEEDGQSLPTDGKNNIEFKGENVDPLEQKLSETGDAGNKSEDLDSNKEADEELQKSEKGDKDREGFNEKVTDGEQDTGANVDSSEENMNSLSTKGLDSISEKGDSSPQTSSKEDLEKLLGLESELSTVKAKLDLLVN